MAGKATPPNEQIEVHVFSVSNKGSLVILGQASGAIELERGSHPDLSRVKAGTEVTIEISVANKRKLDAGNTVRGKFIGIKQQEAVSAPRGSDGQNS